MGVFLIRKPMGSMLRSAKLRIRLYNRNLEKWNSLNPTENYDKKISDRPDYWFEAKSPSQSSLVRIRKNIAIRALWAKQLRWR